MLLKRSEYYLFNNLFKKVVTAIINPIAITTKTTISKVERGPNNVLFH